MLKFGEKRVAKEKFYAAKKTIKPIKPLVLIMPKMSEYVKTFKIIDGYKCKDDEKLLEIFKTIWTKTGG